MWKYLSYAALAAMIFVVLPLAMAEGFKRETARKQAVLEHNCAHYGEAMKDWAEERGYADPCAKVGP